VAAFAPAPPQQMVPAGFAIRTVAYLFDALLLTFCGGAFPFLVISNSYPNGHQPGGTGGSVGGGSVLVSLIYFVVFWSYLGGGRTLGMRLLGLRVIREDGGPLGFIGALVRWVGLWISFAVCFIGVLWVAGDSRKQGWHDKLAHTLVIRV
jgi:uncharacterized RDD family membrane protein YckC